MQAPGGRGGGDWLFGLCLAPGGTVRVPCVRIGGGGLRKSSVVLVLIRFLASRPSSCSLLSIVLYLVCQNFRRLPRISRIFGLATRILSVRYPFYRRRAYGMAPRFTAPLAVRLLPLSMYARRRTRVRLRPRRDDRRQRR